MSVLFLAPLFRPNQDWPAIADGTRCPAISSTNHVPVDVVLDLGALVHPGCLRLQQVGLRGLVVATVQDVVGNGRLPESPPDTRVVDVDHLVVIDLVLEHQVEQFPSGLQHDRVVDQRPTTDARAVADRNAEGLDPVWAAGVVHQLEDARIAVDRGVREVGGEVAEPRRPAVVQRRHGVEVRERAVGRGVLNIPTATTFEHHRPHARPSQVQGRDRPPEAASDDQRFGEVILPAAFWPSSGRWPRAPPRQLHRPLE